MQLLITPLLVTRIVEFERKLCALPKDAQFAAFFKKLQKDTSILDIQTLGFSMEFSLSSADAQAVLEMPEHGATQQHFKLLRNSLSVLRFIKTLREGMFTGTVLQQENKLLVEGFTDFWEEGKIRAAHEMPSYLHDGLRNRPHPQYQLWTDFRQMISIPEQELHPLLLGAVATYHIVYSTPFLMFNLQTALLAAQSIIKPTRYAVSGMISPMTALWKILQKTDFTLEAKSEHLSFFVEQYVKELYRQLDTIVDALGHQNSISPEIRASLNDRQLRILTYLKQYRKLTRIKASTMMGVATVTAFRDLNDLVVKGLIKPVGQGRGTGYILATIPTPGELPNHEASDTITTIQDNIESYD